MQKKNIYRQQIDDPDFETYSITDHLLDCSDTLDRTVAAVLDRELADLMVLAKAVDMVKSIKDSPNMELDVVLDNFLSVAELYITRRQKMSKALIEERQADRALLDSALMRDDQKH